MVNHDGDSSVGDDDSSVEESNSWVQYYYMYLPFDTDFISVLRVLRAVSRDFYNIITPLVYREVDLSTVGPTSWITHTFAITRPRVHEILKVRLSQLLQTFNTFSAE